MPHYSGPQGEDGDIRPAALRADGSQVIQIRKTGVVPVSTGKAPLSKADGPQNDAEIAEMRGIPYREAVGALMWVANMTRPDLAYTAHMLAKFGGNPWPERWKAVMKALQYLKRTASLGVTYGGATEDNMKLSEWVDADHASCPDTRRSVSGGAVMLGGGAICWFSREGFNDWGGRGYDDFVPGEVTKTAPSGDRPT